MFVIYALIDSRSTAIKYVGMTNDLTERFIVHLRGREVNTAKNEWVRELRMLGLVPMCRTLQTCQDEREAREMERRWIAAFLELNEPLFNVEATSRQR